ncbi:hypothetical protein SCA6_016976 [Theobroma cacao]
MVQSVPILFAHPRVEDIKNLRYYYGLTFPLCHPDKRSALLQFKESLNLSRLTSLDLSYSNFSGQIPSEILELSQLELLDLSGNSMKLRKPGLRSLLEKLTNLQGLYLTDVRISSSVPNILSNFSSLKALILSNCDLR